MDDVTTDPGEKDKNKDEEGLLQKDVELIDISMTPQQKNCWLKAVYCISSPMEKDIIQSWCPFIYSNIRNKRVVFVSKIQKNFCSDNIV